MGEDRLSSLPDDILHWILRDLPLKQAVRTGTLSRRWASQWLRALAEFPVLDLVDRDFTRGQPAARAAATVSRCLQLHAEHGAPLEGFRVALRFPSEPGEGALGRDVIWWVAAAVQRGARVIEVDLAPALLQEDAARHADPEALLELPVDLFQERNSLERLALGRFSLRGVPLPAAGLAGLRSLSLSHVDITDEALRGLLANCLTLERLSLSCCTLLAKASVASERLRALELVGCWAVEELRVAAPALESFTLYGHIFAADASGWGVSPVDFDLGTTPALRDAYLSHLGCDNYLDAEHNMAYPYLCHVVADARILTLCSIGLLMVDSHSWDKSAFRDMPNLEELQLLMGPLDHDEDLEQVSSFFVVIPVPVLQRLFVRLPSDPAHRRRSSAAEDDHDTDMILEKEIVLDQLTFIKIVNFSGTQCELRLLRFFLKRAPVLQQLVLVTPEGERAPGDEQLKIIQEGTLALRKASSEAHIFACRPKEDNSPNHPHTRFFHEEYAMNYAHIHHA